LQRFWWVFQYFEQQIDSLAPIITELRTNSQLLTNTSQSKCPTIAVTSGGGAASLDFFQLSGIWIGAAVFSFAGLFALHPD
jgi:hypothetical protein